LISVEFNELRNTRTVKEALLINLMLDIFYKGSR